MPLAHKVKEKTQPNAVSDLLEQLLANAIDVKLSAKQAHWNVKGKSFISLHTLFDKVSTEVEEYVDMLAERTVQLGGTARGTLQEVSTRSGLPGYPPDIQEEQEHVRALSGAINMLSNTSRQAINIAISAGDMVTADLFTEITRGLDKLHWFVRSHIENVL